MHKKAPAEASAIIIVSFVFGTQLVSLHFLRFGIMTWSATRLTLLEGLLRELIALLGNLGNPAGWTGTTL
jgi:hypothetical protein